MYPEEREVTSDKQLTALGESNQFSLGLKNTFLNVSVPSFWWRDGQC